MRGRDIIKAVMAEHQIGEDDFFNSRHQEHVEARWKAIVRMRAAGFNKEKIARLMRRCHATVRYWLDPNVRQRVNLKRTELYHRVEAEA